LKVRQVSGEKGFTIAAALHQAGFPIHSHSLQNRERSLECGIGKCGACEMLVDGNIKRICITKVDDVKKVSEIPHDFAPGNNLFKRMSLLKFSELMLLLSVQVLQVWLHVKN
jgi:hypothetical protein